MDLARVPLLLMLVPLALLSALCSASETALFSLTYSDRLQLRRRSPAAADTVSRLLARPRALLVSILLVANIANVAYYVVSSVIALDRGTSAADAPERGAAGALLSIAISAGLVLAMILVSDLLPKLLARRLRVEFCLVFSRAVWAAFRAVSPVQRVVEHGVIAPLSRLVRPRSLPAATLTVDEVSALLQASAREGALRTEEQQALEDVLQLGAVRVRDAMTPRMEVPWMDASAPPSELVRVARDRGAGRIALCRGSLDAEVLGWVDVKRALAALTSSGEGTRLTEFLRPTLYVPETARLDQVLDLFRVSRRYSALCVDEHGTIVGMIDINDILARFVGEGGAEMEGEHEALEPAGPGEWLVPGRFGLRDLLDIFDTPGRGGLTIRGRPIERRVATVAGLILLALGRLPRVGDRVRLGNLELRVESVRARAIERVRIGVAGAPSGGPRAGVEVPR